MELGLEVKVSTYAILYVVEAEGLDVRIATNLPLGEDTAVVRSSFVTLTQSWRS